MASCVAHWMGTETVSPRRFRYEITTSYLSRYRELLMVHAADHGAIPAGNVDTDLQLGRLSPG